jgi:hypothetical protein
VSSAPGFEQYYEQKMLPVLEALEERRRRAWGGFWKAVAAAVLIALAGLGAAGSLRTPLPAVGAAVLAGALTAIAWAWLFSGLKVDVKRQVIGALARFVEPSLAYEPKGCISESQFRQSDLYSRGIDRYSGEDLVRGKIGATAIAFSEVHAEHQTTHTDGKGHTTTSWETIFRGLFVVADFNKELHSRTLVLPDVAERLFGHLGQHLQGLEALFERAQLVKLEDPEFERDFVVYADDQVEARYVLTPALMQRMVEFRRKADRPVRFSFGGPNVCIAIETGRNMFEPHVSRSLLDRQMLLENLRDLEFATGVVNDLDLNTRIWTKE